MELKTASLCIIVSREKMKDKGFVLNIISRILLFIAGAFCIISQEQVVNILPYTIGSVMIVSGIILFADSIVFYKEKDFSEENDDLLPDSYDNLIVRAFAFLIIGTIIIVSRDNALSIIGISWGIFGIIKGGRNFSYFLYCYFRRRSKSVDEKWKNNLLHKRMVSYLIICIVELTLGTDLLLEPITKLGTHISLLGFQIVIYSILGIDIISEKSDNIKKHILSKR